MKEEKQQRSIAELWGRFSAIKNRFGSDEDYSKLIDISRWQNPARGRVDWVREITSLRTELLERCKEFWAIGDKWAVLGLKAKWGLVSQSCNSSQLMEFGAASFFIAWEIEQRAIDAQKVGQPMSLSEKIEIGIAYMNCNRCGHRYFENASHCYSGCGSKLELVDLQKGGGE